MRNIVFHFLILFILIGIQVFLSTRRNKFPGLILPTANLLGSFIFAALFSDIFSALLALVFSVIPLVIWLCIYQVCRRKLAQNSLYEIKRMKINDL